MREILFRGKRIDNGEWEYGFLCKTYSPTNPKTRDAIMHENDLPLPAYSCAEIDVETVGQFTGLTDRNGNRIFEGDICQTKGFPLIDDKPFVVEWNDDECSFYWRDVLGTDEFNIDVSQNTTIIGNIHDNPELLKGGAE